MKKPAMFTDIHWGAKGNSVLHNQDCLDYIDWFSSQTVSNQCDSIIFMGDWFENRNSINVATLNASFDGLSKLDRLNLPIYFCVGNHDLFHRSTRQQFSTYHFSQFKNVILINEAKFVDKFAFFPFLFNEEYPAMAEGIIKHKSKFVFGHFEFRNFIVTGSDRRIEHGPDHKQFAGPEYIFSGHFHKRQASDNIVYIGNTFPTNYGDAWDDARGMCILDVETSDVDFIDWEDCPKYRKVKLSDILDGKVPDFPTKCRVRCLLDVEISYMDAQTLKDEMVKLFSLREFALEENTAERKDAIAGEEVLENFDLSSLNDAVIKMLQTGLTNASSIESKRLVEIYQNL